MKVRVRKYRDDSAPIVELDTENGWSGTCPCCEVVQSHCCYEEGGVVYVEILDEWKDEETDNVWPAHTIRRVTMEFGPQPLCLTCVTVSPEDFDREMNEYRKALD